MSCTIVTAFYNFSKKKHTTDEYIQWMQNFLPNVDSNMVIFTDQHCVSFICELRQNYPLKTKIVVCPLEEFYTYGYLHHWEKDILRDHERYHSIELYMIWNEKAAFVKRAIELNPFNTDFFCWSDIGMIRDKSYIPYIKNFPNGRSDTKDDKVYLLNIGYRFTEEDFIHSEIASERYRYVSSCIGGGVIYGHKNVFLKWITKYYEMLDEFVKADYFAGKDQSLMACIYVHNRDMIELVTPIPTPFNNDWFYLVFYFC